MYQALYRKYRPRVFDDVAGQEHITETLKRQVAAGRFSHAYLFTGTRGTGKTSCAKILARAVNCQAPSEGNPCNICPSCVGIEDGSILEVLELDAASNNGVDHVRGLRDDANYSPASVPRRVYIVDEVHMLSTPAFNALLKILEEPPAHLMFILATTELHKVPATIKSRCQQFAFQRLRDREIVARLSHVAGLEGIDLTPEAAVLLARLADGGMRDGLSLLDQCAGMGGQVDEAAVLNLLGMAGNNEIAALLGELAGGDVAAALERLACLYAAGREVRALLGELGALIRDLLVRKAAPRGGDGLLTGGYDEGALRVLADGLSAPRLVQMLTVLQESMAGLARGLSPRVDAELCLIRLADETLDGTAAGLSARVARLERLADLGSGFNKPPPKTVLPTTQMPHQRDEEPNPAPAEPPPWDEPTEEAGGPPPGAGPELLSVDDTDDDEPEYRHPDDAEENSNGETGAPALLDPVEASDRGEADLWKRVLPLLKGKVAPQCWPFLSGAVMTAGEYHDGTLTLTVNSAVTRSMIEKPEVLDLVVSQAEELAGCAVTVRVEMKSAAQSGKLGDLVAFGRRFEQTGKDDGE